MKARVTILSKIKRVMAGLLLLIFGLFYANVTLFTHYHVVDGVTIVHSHFYTADHVATSDRGESGALPISGDDMPSDSSHTESEYTFIALGSVYNSVAQVTFFVDLEQESSLDNEYYVEYTYNIFTHPNVSIPQLRAPPAVLSIG